MCSSDLLANPVRMSFGKQGCRSYHQSDGMESVMNSTSLVPYGERMVPTTNKPLTMFINQVSCLRIPTYPLAFLSASSQSSNFSYRTCLLFLSLRRRSSLTLKPQHPKYQSQSTLSHLPLLSENVHLCYVSMELEISECCRLRLEPEPQLNNLLV